MPLPSLTSTATEIMINPKIIQRYNTDFDFANGFNAALAGISLDRTQPVNWQEGWREWDRIESTDIADEWERLTSLPNLKHN